MNHYQTKISKAGFTWHILDYPRLIYEFKLLDKKTALPVIQGKAAVIMAERVGFEPTDGVTVTRFPIVPLRPARAPLRKPSSFILCRVRAFPGRTLI